MNINLLVIPGWGFNAEIMQPFCDSLNCHTQLLDIEPLLRETDDLSTIANTLSKDIKQPIHILGWSLGGMIAQTITHQNSNIQSCICLASQNSFVKRENHQGTKVEDLEALSKEAPQKMFKKFLMLQHTDPRSIRSVLKTIEPSRWSTESLQNGLSLLKNSAIGTSNNVISTEDAKHRNGEIPRLKKIAGDCDPLTKHLEDQTIIKGAGHLLFLTHSEQTRTLIHDFITQ